MHLFLDWAPPCTLMPPLEDWVGPSCSSGVIDQDSFFPSSLDSQTKRGRFDEPAAMSRLGAMDLAFDTVVLLAAAGFVERQQVDKRASIIMLVEDGQATTSSTESIGPSRVVQGNASNHQYRIDLQGCPGEGARHGRAEGAST